MFDVHEPKPMTAFDYELDRRYHAAVELLARRAETIETLDDRARRVRAERECPKLHPHPDRRFEFSPALGVRYQECDSCGMFTGILA